MKSSYKYLLSILILIMPLISLAQLNQRYFYYVGQQMILEDKYDSAIDILNVLLRDDTTATDAYFLRGIAKYNLGDLLGAEKDFTQALSQNPVFTHALQYRAISRSMLANYDDALNDFARAMEIRPDIFGLYYSRGVTYFMSQQFDKAIEDFTYFIRKSPKVVDAYINRGTCYLQLKDSVNALEDYNMAIKINNLNPDGYFRRSIINLSKKDYDSAFKDLNKAIELDKKNIPALFNRAIAYANTNKPVQAIEDFSKVLEIDSTSSLTYFNRAILFSQIGAYAKALNDYSKVSFYSPSNVIAHYNRGNINSILGNIDEAIDDYTKAISLYPDFANAYLGRSSVKYRIQDMEGSKKDYDIGNQKIAEYRNKMSDSTFSVYSDTSKLLNSLVSFDVDFGNKEFDTIKERAIDEVLLSLFRFAIVETAPLKTFSNYTNNDMDKFTSKFKDYIVSIESEFNRGEEIYKNTDEELDEYLSELDTISADQYFLRGITLHSINQYSSAISQLTKAINRDKNNGYYYLNRAVVNCNMTEFISKLDALNQRMVVDSDPVNQLKNSERIYSYDMAMNDINKAEEYLKDNCYVYYNKGYILYMSGKMTEALDAFTKAIELYPNFAEAYYNRGLIQISLKDTAKGLMDISRAGELGIKSAYQMLKKYNNK